MTTVLTTTVTTVGPATTPPTAPRCTYRAWSRLLLAPGSVEVRVRFIRSASATPFGLRALNPQYWSSSSSLTSTNVSLQTSRLPEKRKVGGSIPPLATRLFTQFRCSFSLCLRTRHHRFGLDDGANMGPNELPSRQVCSLALT
jgi:hypothetical protein